MNQSHTKEYDFGVKLCYELNFLKMFLLHMLITIATFNVRRLKNDI